MIIGTLSFGVLILFTFIFVFIAQWTIGYNIRHSLAYFYLMKICGIIFIFMKHALYQSFFTILCSTTRCELENSNLEVIDTGYSCMSQIHIALISCSIVVIIINFALGLLFIVFFSDDQPDSKLPWAHCRSSFNIYKYMQKFVISISLYLEK